MKNYAFAQYTQNIVIDRMHKNTKIDEHIFSQYQQKQKNSKLIDKISKWWF